MLDSFFTVKISHFDGKPVPENNEILLQVILFFLTFVLKEIWICHHFDCTAHVFTIHMYLSASREICLSATSIRANVWCMFDSQMCRCGACVTSGNGPYLRMRCPFQAQLLIGNCQLVDMLHQYHQLWGTNKCFLLKIYSKVVCPSLSSSTSEVNPPDPSVKCHWRCHPTLLCLHAGSVSGLYTGHSLAQV